MDKCNDSCCNIMIASEYSDLAIFYHFSKEFFVALIMASPTATFYTWQKNLRQRMGSDVDNLANHLLQL